MYDPIPSTKEPPNEEEAIVVEVASNLDSPNGFKILVVLLCMVVAILPYCLSLEGGKGVDAVSGIMMKLITCFLMALLLLISSILYLISLALRITFTGVWNTPAFGDKSSFIKTYHVFLASLAVSTLAWTAVFLCQDWGYTENEVRSPSLR